MPRSPSVLTVGDLFVPCSGSARLGSRLAWPRGARRSRRTAQGGRDLRAQQLHRRCARRDIVDAPTELAHLYADHDVLVARAGRNVTAEALYCGIPTVLLPIDSDRHRAAEQAANAIAAAWTPHMRPLTDWRQPGALERAIEEVLALAATGHRDHHGSLHGYEPGNQAAIVFLDRIIAAARQRPSTSVRHPAAAPIAKRASSHG